MEYQGQLSENKRKQYSKLARAKGREESGLFLAEGEKVVLTMLPSYVPEAFLLADGREDLLEDLHRRCQDVPVFQTDQTTIRSISQLQSAKDLLAVFRIPEDFSPILPASGIIVALDRVQDPGNMGTIIRLCDWLGISTLLCGVGCVDVYNPKVVQASAGALSPNTLFRNVDLSDLLTHTSLPVVGTRMDAPTVFSAESLEGLSSAIILFGNEGQGLSSELSSVCTHWLSVPPAPQARSESLNVGVSAAIILSQLLHP